MDLDPLRRRFHEYRHPEDPFFTIELTILEFGIGYASCLYGLDGAIEAARTFSAPIETILPLSVAGAGLAVCVGAFARVWPNRHDDDDPER